MQEEKIVIIYYIFNVTLVPYIHLQAFQYLAQMLSVMDKDYLFL